MDRVPSKLEVIIQAAIPSISILALIFSIVQFNLSLQQSRAATAHELEKIYKIDSLSADHQKNERRVKLYVDICQSIGQICSNDRIDKAFKTSAKNFYSLYYGYSRLYLPDDVMDEMGAFKLQLDRMINGYNPSNTQIRTSGFKLSERIRNLMP